MPRDDEEGIFARKAPIRKTGRGATTRSYALGILTETLYVAILAAAAFAIAALVLGLGR